LTNLKNQDKNGEGAVRRRREKKRRGSKEAIFKSELITQGKATRFPLQELKD
jgi:hypothetical protein